jgi:hypothetical protein
MTTDVDFEQLKIHLYPKWDRLTASVGKNWRDPRFGSRADVLPKKSAYKATGGLTHGSSIDNEA